MIVGRWYVQLAAIYMALAFHDDTLFIIYVYFNRDCNLNFLCFQRRNTYS